MGINSVEELLNKYIQGNCTAEEKALVETWFLDELNKSKSFPEDLDYKKKEQEIWNVLSHRSKKKRTLYQLWPQIAAAVLIILFIGGAYFYVKDQQQNTLYVNTIKPGGNKATLILANGHSVVLDDAADGEIVIQPGIIIKKTVGGQLIYRTSNAVAAPLTYNTIVTPKGGQYQVILPDETKVWLNAESSLRYPTLFADDERQVELSGEAYFEVAQDKKRPFSVLGKDQIVEVLGTHFNINSYTDESTTTTTLLEGAVKVSLLNQSEISSDNSKLLTPGQQARLTTKGISINQVELDDVVAWKNGVFLFNDEPLEVIMRKIARWYDVDIVFHQDVDKSALYGGGISKYENVSKVLEKLELIGGIHFKIEERRIIVTK